jgi:centrin-3
MIFTKLVRIPFISNKLYNFLLHSAADMIFQRDSRDEIVKAFKLFDDDETGKISLKKLRRIAR